MLSIRKEKIIQLLKLNHNISIKELGKYLQVSLNTVRSDIYALVKLGIVSKTHGQVILTNDSSSVSIPSGLIRQHHFLAEKRKIAQTLLAHLPKNKTLSLFIDSSTTSLEVTKLLALWVNSISIITNCLNVPLCVKMNKNIYNGTLETLDIRQAMGKFATEIWIVADHSKFDQISLIKIFSFSDIHKIFTDRRPSDKWLEFFTLNHIECIY